MLEASCGFHRLLGLLSHGELFANMSFPGVAVIIGAGSGTCYNSS
jgi:hypothetical protein